MFSWHESTRRRLCRLAFLALAVVPTCAVLAAAAWVRSPSACEYERRDLAEILALDVTLGAVSYPRPHATLYEDLTVTDPESSQVVAHMRALEIDSSGTKTILTYSQPELNAGRIDLLWELALRRLRRQLGTRQPLEMFARQLKLNLPIGEQTLSDVSGRFDPTDTGTQGVLAFHLAGNEEVPISRLALFRSRQATGATTLVRLDTGGQAFPGALMTALCPCWEELGSETTFLGKLSWQHRGNGWAAELSGRLQGLDLDRLVSRRFGPKLSGTAELNIDLARIERSRLVTATGTLQAGPGLVQRWLLAAAAKELGAVTSSQPVARGDLASYEQLALRFAMNDAGLALQGICDDAPPGTIFVGRQGALLKEPPTGLQPNLNLVRMLAGTSGDVVPSTPAAQAILRALPPSGVRVAAKPGNEPEARLKSPLR